MDQLKTSNIKNRTSSKECCVIIITHNGEKWVNECLVSILQGTVVPTIYVVDNCSTDNTLPIVRSFKEVHIIENHENVGFGKANNLALLKTYSLGYNYFFLVNQDTRIERNAVAELIKESKRSNDDVILSPIHLNGKGDALDYVFGSRFKRDQRKFPDHKLFLEDFEADSMQEKYEVKFTNAAFWMLNRKILEDVGLFHPFFFHQGEDVNYWDRARYLGYKMLVAGKSVAFHDREDRSNYQKDTAKFFKTELLIMLTNPNKDVGFWFVTTKFFDGVLILCKQGELYKIPRYIYRCFTIYRMAKKQSKENSPHLVKLG